MADFSNLPAAVSPPAALAVIAPPRLWSGDDAAGYDLLQSRVAASLGPKDFVEEIWTRDVIDLVWEIFRLRKYKSELMREAAHKGMSEVLKPRESLLDDNNFYRTARQWACGDRDAAAEVNHVLTASGLTMDAVHANTFLALLDRFECIDRMTMMAEGRRDTILRGIDQHREYFAQRLRRAIVDAEDAAFNVIAPEGAAPVDGNAGSVTPESIQPERVA